MYKITATRNDTLRCLDEEEGVQIENFIRAYKPMMPEIVFEFISEEYWEAICRGRALRKLKEEYDAGRLPKRVKHGKQ